MPREISNERIQGVGDYLDRVYKLIPAELTAGYLAAQSYLGVPENPVENVPYLIGIGIVLTALVPPYLKLLQGVSNTLQIVASMVSLPIWAANISITYVPLVLDQKWTKILGLALIVWVLVTPLLVARRTQ